MTNSKRQISYRQVGDYLIPNLTISPEERKITLGRWGMMYNGVDEENE